MVLEVFLVVLGEEVAMLVDPPWTCGNFKQFVLVAVYSHRHGSKARWYSFSCSIFLWWSRAWKTKKSWENTSMMIFGRGWFRCSKRRFGWSGMLRTVCFRGPRS